MTPCSDLTDRKKRIRSAGKSHPKTIPAKQKIPAMIFCVITGDFPSLRKGKN